jgi:hypothetical protein
MSPKLTHLKKLDEKILRLWIEADGRLSEQASSLFLGLLEKRVALLKALRESGEKLHPKICVPSWLEKFTHNSVHFSMRDLKVALAETQKDLELTNQ